MRVSVIPGADVHRVESTLESEVSKGDIEVEWHRLVISARIALHE